MTISRRLLVAIVLVLLTLCGAAAYFGGSWAHSDHNVRPAAGGSWYIETE